MEYVTSRRFRLTEDRIRSWFWFNLWQKKLWPYEQLQDGDILYWYETPSGRIVWKTVVEKVRTFSFSSRAEALEKLKNEFGAFDENQEYVQGKAERGYCLAFRVHSPQKLELSKPPGLKFRREGWMKGTDPLVQEWIGSAKAAGA